MNFLVFGTGQLGDAIAVEITNNIFGAFFTIHIVFLFILKTVFYGTIMVDVPATRIQNGAFI